MILKCVIPAAGMGTRMLPAAKAIPKEMMPVVDRPVIQWVVEEAAAAGIRDVLMVTSREKKAIEDHFDRCPELEERLSRTGKLSLLASLEALRQKVQVHSVRQGVALGLGHAVLQGKSHVGNEPFLCQLGDTLFTGDVLPAKQLVEAFAELGTSVIGLEEVAPERVSRYGIVAGAEVSPGVYRLSGVVEKPKVGEAPSRLAICARYVLLPEVFGELEGLKPGAGGELQLSDALDALARRGRVHGVVLKARRHDIGNPTDWLKANLALARNDASLWERLRGEFGVGV